MSARKASQAIIKTARLNPINATEAKALEIIDDLESKGFNFKQIVVDAILRSNGVTPEMFDADSEPTRMMAFMESMLQEFGANLIREIQSRSFVNSAEPQSIHDDHESKTFTDNFAKSFMQRQHSILGDQMDVSDDDE